MPVTLIVFTTGTILALALAGISRFTRTGAGPLDPEPVEHWLVVHTARHPRLQRGLSAADRRIAGGAAVAASLMVVWVAALAVGWVFDTVDTNQGFARWDQAVAEWGAGNATSTSNDVLSAITLLGDTTLVLVVMTVVAVFDYRRRRNPAVVGFLATVGAGVSLLNNSLKWLVERERPPVEHLVDAASSSFLPATQPPLQRAGPRSR